ncbi:TIGR03915 family putative DNA repair protein [Bengtsoniella intestinalis]|uniref:TIGR03915 family putative DNA repair protein n=1 Tax=Bengtsoniella intestinalis TaxID=3073143 RepID=UPI00391FC6C7
MNMEELIYTYDGSFNGLLCCIFESYAKKETPSAIQTQEELSLFKNRIIVTDNDKANRVYKKVVKLSRFTANILKKAHLTCLTDKEMHLYSLAVRLINQGGGFIGNQTDPQLYPILQAIRHMEREAHLLRGFVRFSILGGALVGEIEPKNQVLPILRRHFCDRYQNETFFLYDRTHHQGLFYAQGKSTIIPVESFQMEASDDEEAHYRTLWKQFYDTIAIKERENPTCRRTQMPQRFWITMTEFQSPAHFSGAPINGSTDLANALAHAAPTEKPALETPPKSVPYDLGSTP